MAGAHQIMLLLLRLSPRGFSSSEVEIRERRFRKLKVGPSANVPMWKARDLGIELTFRLLRLEHLHSVVLVRAGEMRSWEQAGKQGR